MTVALVYNAKEEASLTAIRSADQPTIPSGSGPFPPLSSLSAPDAHSSTESAVVNGRIDDMYAEWDTMETVLAIKSALEQRHRVELIVADEDAYAKLREIRPHFVFNIAEGLHGVSREAQMPALFEMLQLPYLGSDPLTLSICLDKSRTKEILGFHGIRTAPFSVVSSMATFDDLRVRFPSMVKPLHEGSSKGITNSCVVRDPDELEREVQNVLEVYKQPALIEEFLSGREFTVAIMGNGTDLQVLPIVEIKFDALPRDMQPIYSFEAKWILDNSDNPLDIFECPASLDEALRVEIENMCKATYNVLRCRDWARIDVRLDASSRPHILEVNPLPGILPKPEDNSCLPKAARAAGYTYNQLINSVLDLALARNGVFQPETTLNPAEII